MSARMLPGVLPVDLVQSPGSPPWQGKPIVAPSGYTDADVEWIFISLLAPRQSRHQTRGRPMVAPGHAYPALVINPHNVLHDGHHRYFDLVDKGWRSRVPVVRQKPAPGTVLCR